MSFEEQFPELKYYPKNEHYIQRIKGISLPEARTMYNEQEIRDTQFVEKETNKEEIVSIPTIDLQRFCLSKQRVREAIMKVFPPITDDGRFMDKETAYKITLLLRELGL